MKIMINDQLRDLYQSKWKELSKAIEKHKDEATNPLLISLKDETAYVNSKQKIMIIGQETNDWECYFNSKKENFNHLLSEYEKFYWDGRCYRYGGAFWNTIKNLKEEINKKENISSNSIQYIWNNILKIGKKGEKRTPSKDIIDITFKYFDVIKDEIKILQPNVVIFFTGPDYDQYLRQTFEDLKFEALGNHNKRHISTIKSQYLPPNKTVRLYHPGYLLRSSKKLTFNWKEIVLSLIE